MQTHTRAAVTSSAHLLPSRVSSRQRAKHRALQATGLHVEIKEDFTDPTLATFSEIQSFGLSQLQTVLGCLVTEGHCFAAGFGKGKLEGNSLSQSQKDFSYFSWCQLRSNFSV